MLAEDRTCSRCENLIVAADDHDLCVVHRACSRRKPCNACRDYSTAQWDTIEAIKSASSRVSLRGKQIDKNVSTNSNLGPTPPTVREGGTVREGLTDMVVGSVDTRSRDSIADDSVNTLGNARVEATPSVSRDTLGDTPPCHAASLGRTPRQAVDEEHSALTTGVMPDELPQGVTPVERRVFNRNPLGDTTVASQVAYSHPHEGKAGTRPPSVLGVEPRGEIPVEFTPYDAARPTSTAPAPEVFYRPRTGTVATYSAMAGTGPRSVAPMVPGSYRSVHREMDAAGPPATHGFSHAGEAHVQHHPATGTEPRALPPAEFGPPHGVRHMTEPVAPPSAMGAEPRALPPAEFSSHHEARRMTEPVAPPTAQRYSLTGAARGQAPVTSSYPYTGRPGYKSLVIAPATVRQARLAMLDTHSHTRCKAIPVTGRLERRYLWYLLVPLGT